MKSVTRWNRNFTCVLLFILITLPLFSYGEFNFLRLHQQAVAGDVKAQYRLAKRYFCGYGVEHSNKDAALWFRMAAEQGDAEAQFQLARCYNKGFCCDPEQVSRSKRAECSLVWLRKAVAQEHTMAQAALAEAYERGIGVVESPNEALFWYHKAANGGLIEAQLRLADCYERGIGVQKDERLAFYWIQVAAKQDHIEALMRLGQCYEDGVGVTRSLEKAFECYQKAAFLYQTSCQARELYGRHDRRPFERLAIFYELGYGVKQSWVEALRAYQIAGKRLLTDEKKLIMLAAVRQEAESGNKEAWRILGSVSITQEENVEVALTCYQKAVACGDVIAMCVLGKYYLTNNQCFLENPDRKVAEFVDDARIDEAIKWFLEAAKHGNTEAKYILATLVLFDDFYDIIRPDSEEDDSPGTVSRLVPFGKVTRFSTDEGMRWLQDAAMAGAPEAQLALAKCYLKGHCIEQNLEYAFQWCFKSATQGYGPACLQLSEFYERGVGVKPSEELAEEWWYKGKMAD